MGVSTLLFGIEIIFVLVNLIIIEQACVPVAVRSLHHVHEEQGVFRINLLTKKAEEKCDWVFHWTDILVFFSVNIKLSVRRSSKYEDRDQQ
jgi:hypothetical protein